jgi:hypothetical protein
LASYSDITSALTKSVVDLNADSLGGLEIAHEGQNFDPSPYSQFLSLFTLFGERISLSKTTLDEVLGVYQVTLKRKIEKNGVNRGSFDSIIDSILANYRHNDEFVYNATRVVIINSTRNNARNVDGWWTCDVSINFKTDDLRA